MHRPTKNFVLLLALLCILPLQSISLESTGSENRQGFILGYGLMNRIVGLWNGPVETDTPAGNFPTWYVDFRPVSPGQVSQYSLLDHKTINNLSFFIVKHDGELKVAMRTEGCFDDACCVTYEVCDKADERSGYYRFSDFLKGPERAYTEFTFGEEEFLMEVYTNKFNKKEKTELHSRWQAELGDRRSAREACENLGFPQAFMVKDFSDAFRNMTESIFYSFENDPYPSSSQPYVGSLTVNIKISNELKVREGHELFLLLTTESMFSGLKYDPESDKYYSKYVYLPVGTESFTIKNLHPGKYYLYGYNDVDGDRKHKAGDWMSSDLANIVHISPGENAEASTLIDFIIP